MKKKKFKERKWGGNIREGSSSPWRRRLEAYPAFHQKARIREQWSNTPKKEFVLK